MAKVTSKLQVTIPKAIADQYGIKPGDEIAFKPAGPQIRVVPPRSRRKRLSRAELLRLFDAEEARIQERWKDLVVNQPVGGRDWTREDLYERDGRYRGEPVDREPGDAEPD
ncbi:MAG: AbrB/MazE/SpoVT family DNA-binding domain-containing protein [Thermoanaerobaculia bacterium]